jgi:hypothetical protein
MTIACVCSYRRTISRSVAARRRERSLTGANHIDDNRDNDNNSNNGDDDDDE